MPSEVVTQWKAYTHSLHPLNQMAVKVISSISKGIHIHFLYSWVTQIK